MPGFLVTMVCHFICPKTEVFQKKGRPFLCRRTNQYVITLIDINETPFAYPRILLNTVFLTRSYPHSHQSWKETPTLLIRYYVIHSKVTSFSYHNLSCHFCSFDVVHLRRIHTSVHGEKSCNEYRSHLSYVPSTGLYSDLSVRSRSSQCQTTISKA